MQSKLMSFIEAWANVIVGCVVSMVANAIVFPTLGVHFTFGQNVYITVVFTAISIVRSYCLRRWFNRKTKS